MPALYEKWNVTSTEQCSKSGGFLQIINLAKNIKTPSLTVYLIGDAARDREAAKNVQCSLEYTTLRRVTEATEIHYDPDPEVGHQSDKVHHCTTAFVILNLPLPLLLNTPVLSASRTL